MAEYDTISKHLIQSYPKDFIRFTLARDDVEVLDILDTGQTTVKAQYPDSLIRVRIGEEEALIHHEFQTTDSTDPPMPFRMVGYIGRAIEQHRLPIYSNVIYLRPNAGKNDLGYYVQELAGYQIAIQYRVVRLTEVEGQRVLDSGHSGLLPFTPLMKPPEGMDSESWLRACIHATNALPIDNAIKVDILGNLMILSGLGYESTTINRILSQEGLMDAIMRESSFAQYIKQQGIEEGIKQGIEQGNRERAIEDILDVLAIRFDLSTAPLLSARIAAIEDLQRLKQLLHSAIQVSNLEAFGRLLD